MTRNITLLKWGYGAGYLILLASLYLFTYFVFIKHREPAVTEICFADRITAAHKILIPSVIDGLVYRFAATERSFLDTYLPFILG